MRRFLAVALLLVLFSVLTGCLFKEPVFTSGFEKVDPALAGIWVSEDESGDPRKIEFAAFVPIDDERYLLHYPGGAKDGIYYEARALQVRGRLILQLRMLASFADGLPKPDADRYTLLWLDRGQTDSGWRVRALDGDKLHEKDPAMVRKVIEDPARDWTTFFGDPKTFRKLKDE